jgi:hypothetical protein
MPALVLAQALACSLASTIVAIAVTATVATAATVATVTIYPSVDTVITVREDHFVVEQPEFVIRPRANLREWWQRLCWLASLLAITSDGINGAANFRPGPTVGGSYAARKRGDV